MNDRPAPYNGQGDPDSQPGDDSQPESVQRTRATSNPNGPLRCYAHVSDEDPQSPWAEKTVLALDGGGIRGYSSLLILQHLMSKIEDLEKNWTGEEGPVESSFEYPWREKEPSKSGFIPSTNQFYPCHYFDYIAGTSTGGLSAIMLSRLRMSIDEALTQYTEFGNSVFGQPRWFHERSLSYLPRAKYPSRKVRGAILRLIHERLLLKIYNAGKWQAQHESFASRDDQSRTMAVSFSKDPEEGIDQFYLFRSYSHNKGSATSEHRFRPMNPGPAHSGPLWEVARATSAAPTYFEAITFMNRKFLDGGLGANNPGRIALQEVCQMHAPHRPALLVSVGTGVKRDNRAKEKPKKRDQARDLFKIDRPDKVPRKQGLQKLMELTHFMKDFTTDTEVTENDLNFTAHEMQVPYRRLNVSNDLATCIPLDDWRPAQSGQITLNAIKDYTNEYLKLQTTQEDLTYCAQVLVARRRRRAITERWEWFATDIKYHCQAEGCLGSPLSQYKKRGELRKHLKRSHSHELTLDPDDLEARLDDGRILTEPKKKETENGAEKSNHAPQTKLTNGHSNANP
ncbi:hypothetical protein EPUS_08561 [Endocarpon pusillum Z07020]|uniref:PNPLA domain-containing protein n=1 Tax=Endocarpon pusillum (strain Z07020 / HMAS-L-300199) TaxID=1263415 RepID=U1GNA7_ENDPU|nr:uncharacterized protein EPUS_08561 [Endocarpon pusillum Z07020]ERF73763.1 hypothetical protein EPUS_08561 [Endocarpon pusillum Z07020]